MIEQLDTLLVVAEIAVAFAGFASIVSVVGQRAAPQLPVRYRWSLRGMIVCALTVAFAALLPALLSWFELPTSLIWRAAAGVLALLCVLLLIGGVRDTSMVAAHSSLVARMFWLVPLPLSGLCAVAVALDQVVMHAAWYLTSLLLMLLLAGLLFGNIVMSQVAPRD